MNWSDLDWIYKRPSIETFQKGNLEKHLISLNTRIQSQLELGAEERYLKFILDYPKVAEYAQNKHIASYWGISPQSLSRLRLIWNKYSSCAASLSSSRLIVNTTMSLS